MADTKALDVQLHDFPLKAGPHTHLVAERDRLRGLAWEHFEAKQLGTTIGAELSGVDLTAELDDVVISEILQALYAYKVIFFRDQELNATQHTMFARRFGELEEHPFIPSNTDEPELVRFEKSEKLGGYENAWHHDVTWRESPSMGAVLHAVSVPAIGGDTLFSDMYAAYECLDDSTKEQIEDLWAIHDFTQTFGYLMSPEDRAKMQETYPPVRHPVVCTHPGTGRRHLYVNRGFVRDLEGFDHEEGIALVDRLCRQADYPEHQCRFTWTDHAVAFWDNRAVQHYAASDYWPQVRVMERASIIGTKPVK